MFVLVYFSQFYSSLVAAMFSAITVSCIGLNIWTLNITTKSWQNHFRHTWL